MAIDMNTDIRALYGVGAARAKAYARLGVSNVGELLGHYPKRYENRGDVKLLCDADIPKRIRDSLPIAEDGEGILYVPYIGARDLASADKNTEKAINLMIFKKKGTHHDHT